jgi:hypothetical protein
MNIIEDFKSYIKELETITSYKINNSEDLDEIDYSMLLNSADVKNLYNLIEKCLECQRIYNEYYKTNKLNNIDFNNKLEEANISIFSALNNLKKEDE